MRYFIKTILTVFVSLICFSSIAQIDTSAAASDTTSCLETFFARAGKVDAKSKFILVNKAGKVQTYPAFLKTLEGGEPSMSGLADLDNDGKKELVIYSYTGGAHCCDEIFVYKNTGTGKYQFAGKTYAGDVCITGANEFQFDFYESFGYFYTCFACEYSDSSAAGPTPRHGIILKYSKGKLSAVPGDKDLANEIKDNLEKLHAQPYEKLDDEAAQDNGLRKEFAFNLAVYYYSFGKNLPATKQLFDKYYTYPDAKKVWPRFVSLLNGVIKSNNF